MTPEAVERLRKYASRMRSEAVMDDHAADTTKNDDARPYFSAWANDKRTVADDIEALLKEVQP